ncbi:MAG: CIA30 family protein [Psychroflexus sp.]|nr:CIA30 family protein [Psychroflexus sp.]
MSVNAQQTIFSFPQANSTEEWQIVNDGVMGGLSESKLNLTEKGYGQFLGHVSLENNGGFASMRLLTNIQINSEYQHVILYLKGDSKNYQFRLKGDQSQPQSYVQEFKTNGEWQTIKLKLSGFSPQFRGRALDLPNFNFSKIEEVRFLIANKKEEDFKLLVKSIGLE